MDIACVFVGYLNGWLGDRTGAFGVPGGNDNSRMVVQFWAERGLCLGNTYFKHMSLYKYTTVVRGQGGMEVKSKIDLVLVKKDMLRYVQDVRTVRGMGRGLSDHHLALCKVRLMGAWIKRTRVMVEARRISSVKLREDRCRVKRVEEEGDNNIEHMWEEVKWAMFESAKEECGLVRMGERTQRMCDGTMK